MFSLAAKKILVVGIANEHSIAWGCARAFRDQGADLAVTYLNAKAEPYVRPLAEELGVNLVYAGHYATETLGVQALAADVAKKFRLSWVFVDHPTGL